MLTNIFHHPWLFGILCLLPPGLLLAVSIEGLLSQEILRSGIPILKPFYLASLVVLAFLVGFCIFMGLTSALGQTLTIPRILAVCCVFPPLIIFFISVINHFHHVGTPTLRTEAYDWILCAVCWVGLPALFSYFWNFFGRNVAIGSEFQVSIGDLCKTYIPWIIAFWTPIFCYLTCFSWAMGGEMIYSLSKNNDALIILLRLIAQYVVIVIRICLKNSLGLTSAVILIGEVFQCFSSMGRAPN